MEHAQASLFRLIDTDHSGTLSHEEWMRVFDALDADRDGCISRKEWHLKQGQTVVFDAIQHKYFAAIQRKEWESTFQAVDRDGSGTIDLQGWAKAQVAQSAEKGRSPVVAEPLHVDVRALSGEVIASLQVTPAWSGAQVKDAVNSQVKSERTVAMMSILRECGAVVFGDDQTVESVGLTSSESLQVVLTESELKRKHRDRVQAVLIEPRAPPPGYALRTGFGYGCARCGFGSVYLKSSWTSDYLPNRSVYAEVWNHGVCASPECGYTWSEVS
jgi:hypothetical protein